MVPRTVLTRYGPILLNTARPVNIVQSRTVVNNAGPMKNVINNAYSIARRPFNKLTVVANKSNFTKKVNTVKGTRVNTARPKAVISAVKGNKGNAVKASACWVWRPKHKVLDHVSKNNGASMSFKRFDYIDAQGTNSWMLRHMIGNRSYLTNYEEIDGGFVAFRGNSKGGKITGKDFKLTDESHVLLKVPRKDNMYNVDLKNVVPQGGIENLIDLRVKVIRCDNGTEFKNRVMNQLCEMKGIKREFSVARTPQQNGVEERKNRTLIEAARTMLADSKLPTTFWAEVVNTACYVQNRVLVIKPHNKTPYELFLGRKPALSFMRPFGCPVTILNTIDHLGKFDGKADEGFFIGYSTNSKAFRVFNSRTRIVEENLHVKFSKDTPNISRSRPNWLFDIDAITNSMNYKPVVARNQSNGNAGTKAYDDAGKTRMKIVSGKDYILLPLWTQDLPFSSSLKDSPDAGFKPSGEEEKKDAKDLENKDSEKKDCYLVHILNEKPSTSSMVSTHTCKDTQLVEDGVAGIKQRRRDLSSDGIRNLATASGHANPICNLGDYPKPTHEGYRNTIELPVGNNVVHLRPDTIRLVQNGCSFHRLQSEDPNQHLKDFLRLVDSLDLNGENRERTRLRLFQFSLHDQASNWLECLPVGSITTWEDLTTHFIAQFFPPGRTAKLRNDILMFQQHQGESPSESWTRFKDLLEKVPHHDIDLWLQLRDRNAEESWALLEDLALYDNKSWNNPRDFAKSVKAISLPQDVLSTSDCRLIELENQVQRLMEAHLAPTQSTQVNKITNLCEIYSKGLVSNFMASQDARLSKFEADFKQQQSEMTNKIDTVLKAITDRLARSLSSDTIKNPKLNEANISQTSQLQPRMGSETQQLEEPEPTLEDEFQDLHLNLPVLEVLAHAPIYNAILDKYVKSLELGKSGLAFVQGEVSAKIEDPRLFTLPCRLGESKPCDTLADLGSCLADGTKSYPVGIVKDVEVHTGKLKLLNDFYVIDMKKDPEIPLLVGRGFLATANAIIDCRMAKIAVGEGITRSVFDVKGVDLGEEEAPYWTTLGKKESYKPRPRSDGVDTQIPSYTRKDFLDCCFPREWEIARDVEINPLRMSLCLGEWLNF
ncbi:ribonuclease H-like domain-containing protein [Tanacetum coccineum]